MKNFLKYFIVFLFLIIYNNSISGQVYSLKGVVLMQSSNSTPISGVRISDFGANTTFTNDDGHFQLMYANKRPGHVIKLFVEKEGFEVINQKELETLILPSDPNYVIKIILAREGERDQAALRYYQIFESSIAKSFDEKLKEIQIRYDSLGKLKSKEYEAEIARLQAQKNASISSSKELAENFSKVDLDNSSIIYRRALNHFIAGEINKTIEVLDSIELKGLYKLPANLSVTEKRQVQQIIKSFNLKFEALRVTLNFKEAKNQMSQIINLQQKYFGKEHIGLIDSHEKLAIAYKSLGDYSDMKDSHYKAVTIRRKLIEKENR